MENDLLIRITRGKIPQTQEYICDNFLDDHGFGNFFQSPAVPCLYGEIGNYETLLLTAFSDERMCGVLLAVLIREKIKGISYPRLLVQSGPVIEGNQPTRLRILDSLLGTLKKEIPLDTVFIEIRNNRICEQECEIFMSHGFSWHDHLNGILNIQSREQVMSGIAPAKQRQIKRGFENGANIVLASSLSEVKEFYHLLANLYKVTVKKPLPPYSFFKNFYLNTQSTGKGVILLVKAGESLFAGIVYPFSGIHTVYVWYIASTGTSVKNIYPGVLATWAGIEYAIDHGFKYFDFMGLGTPAQPYGVRNFKKQFGGEVINFGRWRYVNNKTLYNLSLIGYKVMKRFAK